MEEFLIAGKIKKHREIDKEKKMKIKKNGMFMEPSSNMKRDTERK